MTTDRDMRALERDATPGPWEWSGAGNGAYHGLYDIEDETAVIDTDWQSPWVNVGWNDTRFIATTRDWVPDALDRFDRLRELHHKSQWFTYAATVPVCAACGGNWPCATRRIIDEEGDDQ